MQTLGFGSAAFDGKELKGISVIVNDINVSANDKKREIG